MKLVCILLIGCSSLPLLAYPFALIANLMMLSAVGNSEDTSLGVAIVQYAFLASTTLYPLPYTVALIKSITKMEKKRFRNAALWQLLPLSYLLMVVIISFLFAQAG